MKKSPTRTEALAPLLTIDGLAAYLNKSKRSLYRMLAAGELLAPLGKLGAGARWRLADVDAWIEAGFPRQEVWERMRNRQVA